MKQTFYSNGKLLITGEYLVLDGAEAFALPTRFGQNLNIEEGSGNLIHWKSYDNDGSIWFEETIPFTSIIRKERFGETKNIKNTLIEILHEAYRMDAGFIANSKGYIITTELTFPKLWGLGTSSTLINNIAQWLHLDAFQLLRTSFGGSGYDIACAQNSNPITYKLVNEKPVVKRVNFDPDFKDNIYFVYLNKKQNSKSAIASYYGKKGNTDKSITKINAITEAVIEAQTLRDFATALQKHEIEMSNILELETIQEALFSDFEGVVKSLGAWGGDFVMSVSKENPTAYFKEKGFDVVIPYQQMIL